MSAFIYGFSRRNPTYTTWMNMRCRCNTPSSSSYKNYGGRGIRVCERWSSYDNFLSDMGQRPEGTTIDRIDVNGNYEPGNCRWATREVQARNRRPRPICSTHDLTGAGTTFVHNGKRKCAQCWRDKQALKLKRKAARRLRRRAARR